MSKARKLAKKAGKSSAKKSTVKISTKTKAQVKAKAKARSTRSLSGFTLPWMKREDRDFTSSFKFGNFSGTVESKGKTVTLNVSLEGKNFDFDGVLSMNEKAFKDLQRIFDKVLDNLR